MRRKRKTGERREGRKWEIRENTRRGRNVRAENKMRSKRRYVRGQDERRWRDEEQEEDKRRA